MPVYEYLCPKCHRVSERWRSVSETDACECPDCCETMIKLISKSSFQLKGGGWYADGYCRKKEEKCSATAKSNSPCCDSTAKKEPKTCAAGNC